MGDNNQCIGTPDGEEEHVFSDLTPGTPCGCGGFYLNEDLEIRSTEETPCWGCEYSGGGDDSCFDCDAFSAWHSATGQSDISQHPKQSGANVALAALLIIVFAVLIGYSWYIGLQLAGPKIFSAAVGLAVLLTGAGWLYTNSNRS